ncbi:sugar O-acetyltransferase [Thioclava sp. GXIMD4215]|uniref:sugar O-acetyltransferase n=1 Tax=Thioclava sp. GXIMD4215 TaxID=3131928 RepID=UPI003243BE3C
MRREKQKMLAGELYRADDPELQADMVRAAQVLAAFNARLDAGACAELLGPLLGALGEGTQIKPPFRCDYGQHIRVGARSFINYNCTILDCALVTIGEEVLIGPNVQIYAATHPLEAAPRRAMLESGKPVRIHDGVWIGGGAIICPGVTIGENAVVGAGAVVTRDVAPATLVAGNPARLIRQL